MNICKVSLLINNIIQFDLLNICNLFFHVYILNFSIRSVQDLLKFNINCINTYNTEKESSTWIENLRDNEKYTFWGPHYRLYQPNNPVKKIKIGLPFQNHLTACRELFKVHIFFRSHCKPF